MNRETKNEKSTNRMSVIKRWIIILLILIAGVLTLSCNKVFANENIPQDTIELIDSPIYEDSIELYDSIRIEMIDVVNEYLIASTKGKHDPLLAQYLVDNALEHNIDLCFMMSQTKIETCFGTAGAGRSTSRRSLFGVVRKRYSSYDEAINDYCIILKKYYLVKGKTENDLMRNYVTSGGYRYASNPNYEIELSAEYRKIAKRTNLLELQNQYYEAIEMT